MVDDNAVPRPVKKVTTQNEKLLLAKTKRLNNKLSRVKAIAESLQKASDQGKTLNPKQLETIANRLFNALNS